MKLVLVFLLLQLPSSAAPPSPLVLGWATKQCVDVPPGYIWTMRWDAVPTPQPHTQPTNNKIAVWNLVDYELYITIVPPPCLPAFDCIPLDPPLPMKEFWPRTKDTQMVFTVFEGGRACFSVRAMGSYYYVY